MCGINGLVGGNRQQLTKMNRMIGHRGPDGSGVYIDRNIALGHLRLSIIDLSAKGKQPMWTDDGRYGIVFNGEIYNYLLLRKFLQQRYRVKFYSHSDTEVILYAYKFLGAKFLQKISGMFAFVIYDKKRGEIFAARDRFGEKPFYYTLKPNFAFSSEIKALLSVTKSNRF